MYMHTLTCIVGLWDKHERKHQTVAIAWLQLHILLIFIILLWTAHSLMTWVIHIYIYIHLHKVISLQRRMNSFDLWLVKFYYGFQSASLFLCSQNVSLEAQKTEGTRRRKRMKQVVTIKKNHLILSCVWLYHLFDDLCFYAGGQRMDLFVAIYGKVLGWILHFWEQTRSQLWLGDLFHHHKRKFASG